MTDTPSTAAAIEELAQSIHTAWLDSPFRHTMHRGIRDSHCPWDELSPEAKYNRRHIASALLDLGYRPPSKPQPSESGLCNGAPHLDCTGFCT